MTPKKKILVLIDWFLPGYKAGGPIRSCANILSHLKDEFEFKVLTTDTDFMDDSPYEDVVADTWMNREDGIAVHYISQARLSPGRIRELLRSEDYDLWYMNSFFSWHFTILPLLIRKFHRIPVPVVLAPRGMLAANALQLKGFKKRLFIHAGKLLRLYHRITWHASTDAEVGDVRAVFGQNARVAVALNLLEKKEIDLPAKQKDPGSATFCFVSRITTKKNLLFAIKLFEALPADQPISFHIYGPVHDHAYWERCQAAMEKGTVDVQYKGITRYEDLESIYSQYHFMLFPTLNENFGHAIIEAMSYGCPVILSDQTPWRDLASKGLGWDIPLDDRTGFEQAIREGVQMDNEAYQLMCQGCHAFAHKLRHDPQPVEQNRRLFTDA